MVIGLKNFFLKNLAGESAGFVRLLEQQHYQHGNQGAKGGPKPGVGLGEQIFYHLFLYIHNQSGLVEAQALVKAQVHYFALPVTELSQRDLNGLYKGLPRFHADRLLLTRNGRQVIQKTVDVVGCVKGLVAIVSVELVAQCLTEVKPDILYLAQVSSSAPEVQENVLDGILHKPGIGNDPKPIAGQSVEMTVINLLQGGLVTHHEILPKLAVVLQNASICYWDIARK